MLVAQSCLTICNPMDCSPPGSSVHGILQARILEWAVISFSRGSSWPWDSTQVSCIPDECFTIHLGSTHCLLPRLEFSSLSILTDFTWLCISTNNFSPILTYANMQIFENVFTWHILIYLFIYKYIIIYITYHSCEDNICIYHVSLYIYFFLDSLKSISSLKVTAEQNTL